MSPEARPDKLAPLSDSLRELRERLLGTDLGGIPKEFKTAISGWLEVNPPKLLVSDMPSLKGEEWRTISSFGTDWSAFSGYSVKFYKDSVGVVRVEGVVVKSSAPSANETIFTLPAGYAPDQISSFTTLGNTAGTALGGIYVDTAGAVKYLFNSGANEALGVNISFRAA